MNAFRLVRRNEVCPGCASGKKYKVCCGAPKVFPPEQVVQPVGAGHPQEQPAQYVNLSRALPRGARITRQREKLS